MSSEPDAYCLGCGCVLRGLRTPRCPECGQPYDPADPGTFVAADRAPSLAVRLRNPPGPLDFGICGVALLVSLAARQGGHLAGLLWLMSLPIVVAAATLLVCRILLLGLTLLFYPELKVSAGEYELARWMAMAGLLAAALTTVWL